MIKNQCLGSGASVGGVQGGMRRGRKNACPVCGKRVGMRGGRAGRLYPHQPLVLSDPKCATCGAVCRWSVDAWVCTDDLCGDEWYPDHSKQYAEPSIDVSRKE